MKTTHDTESFHLSWELPHAREKVWRALTDSNLLEKWIMPNDLRPVVGHQFTFRQQPTQWWDGIVQGEVLEVDPQRRLKYSWKANRESDGSYKLNTTVLWTLAPAKSGGTLLQLEQSGFTQENSQAFAGAKIGWDRNLKAMAELLGQA